MAGPNSSSRSRTSLRRRGGERRLATARARCRRHAAGGPPATAAGCGAQPQQGRVLGQRPAALLRPRRTEVYGLLRARPVPGRCGRCRPGHVGRHRLGSLQATERSWRCFMCCSSRPGRSATPRRGARVRRRRFSAALGSAPPGARPGPLRPAPGLLAAPLPWLPALPAVARDLVSAVAAAVRRPTRRPRLQAGRAASKTSMRS